MIVRGQYFYEVQSTPEVHRLTLSVTDQIKRQLTLSADGPLTLTVKRFLNCSAQNGHHRQNFQVPCPKRYENKNSV